MGRTHALTGLCAGLAASPLLVDTLAQALLFAAVTAGYALLPDLDHPGARASRLLGPVTGALSSGVRAGSRWLYARTKGPRDERHRGEHRHATHTIAFALLAGTTAALGTAWSGPWVPVGIVVLGILFAVDALGDWVLAAAGICGAAWWGSAGDDVLGTVAGTGPLLGIAIALGCVTHCLGDAATLSGCPFLWPLPIAGETWFEIRPPRMLRFRTGGVVEKAAVFPAFVLIAALLVLGLPMA
ncbi:metal-dependent hydrolase [Lentzea sp. NPDC092896]|uniref:metal-dependent hydrolase n=1 Tax=Lentzea sp. NPDC092896 TaxID=3364127 RepID=UPI0037FB5998